MNTTRPIVIDKWHCISLLRVQQSAMFATIGCEEAFLRLLQWVAQQMLIAITFAKGGDHVTAAKPGQGVAIKFVQ